MTPNAFMTTEAWVEMTPHLLKGYRSLRYLKENPQWWYIEIIDGFGAHHNNLQVMKLRDDGKCISVKEEGDSSHVNQAYDRFVAKCDKKYSSQLSQLLTFCSLFNWLIGKSVGYGSCYLSVCEGHETPYVEQLLSCMQPRPKNESLLQRMV